MKKIIVFFVLILFIFTMFLAYDKHFKYVLPKEYKKEIEVLLEREIPKSKAKIDGLYFEIENEKDPFDKEGLIEMGSDEIVFYLFVEIKAIIQKYIDIEKSLDANDDVGQFIMVIMPYLKKNKINTKELDEFLNHADKVRLRIEKDFANFSYFDYLN